ncbi:hypothetical protein HGRIS_005075 [Hohenbuehelia grisea]|uniref:Uncharacterized protein n=1 Tax=Hohenbuehelia grisea TaxID=104357 RepID=A0ABR3JDX7_9AGAR
MTDSDKVLSPMSALRARPPMPQGPRIRTRSSHTSVETHVNSLYSRDSTVFTNYSPTLLSPSSPSSLKSGSESQPLSAISEQPDHELPALSRKESLQAPSPSPSPSPHPSVKVVVKPTLLTPPPRIDFDSVPIQWKSLPLEAAVWTFSSQELQQIVSRSIRSSARESFIRLISIDTLDDHLPAELERLDRLKTMAQARYRFCVHRRTMLLQGLQLCAHPPPGSDAATSAANIGQLTGQLSETTAECDRLLEELLRVADQQAQINKLEDVHWASALAVALRKLNGSYAKRTTELKAARAKIASLEAELEDAWKEAEKMAKEIDENEEMIESDDDDLDEEDASLVMAEHIKILTSPVATHRVLPPISPGGVPPNEPDIQPPPTPTPPPPPPKDPLSSAIGETQPSPVDYIEPRPLPANIPTDLTHEDSFEPQANLTSDTATIRSTRSTRSARSARSARSTRSVRSTKTAPPGESRVSQVSAARRRSIRTSLGSLRFPSLRGKLGNAKAPPPMPDLPKDFAAYFNANSSSGMSPGGAGTPRPLNLSLPGARGGDSGLRSPQRTPLRASIDDIQIVPRTPKVATPQKKTMDDIGVRPGRSNPDPSLASLLAVAEHDTHPGDFGHDVVPGQRVTKTSIGSMSGASPAFEGVNLPLPSRAAAFRSSTDRFSLKLRRHSKSSSGVNSQSTRSRYSLNFPLFTGSGSKPTSRRPLSSVPAESS